MAQLFPPWSNTVARVALVVVVLLPIAVPAALMIAVRTPYQTQEGIAREQPVPFSHQHHAGTLDIDCRYCHDTVETSPFAGMPETRVCMSCHSQLFTNADMLAPVRTSLASNTPLRWTRLHDLPDFAYFDHSIHVRKGVGCESCHGRVDRMPLAYAEHALSMQFCLDCHRQPERHLRPLQEVTTMGWQPQTGQLTLGQQLLDDYHIQKETLTDCSVCHR